VKLLTPENVFASARSVDDAAVPLDVSIYTAPDAFVFKVPAVEVEMLRKPRVRFVVDAAVKDAYVVDENAKRFTPEKKFVSERSVDDAAPESDVRKPASLLNQESLTDEDAIVCTRPPVPRYAKPCELFGRAIEEVAISVFAVTVPPSKYPEPATESRYPGVVEPRPRKPVDANLAASLPLGWKMIAPPGA
jgi:hypothetical protein